MDFPGAQKGKERKSSSSSKGFWGKKDKERRDQSKESRGERSVQGILATPVSFPTNRSGLRKSKQGIGIHCKLEGGPKNGNKLCQLHCTKWISGLKKQLHLFPFPSSPKIAKSPPNWITVEHDHKDSSVSLSGGLSLQKDPHAKNLSEKRKLLLVQWLQDLGATLLNARLCLVFLSGGPLLFVVYPCVYTLLFFNTSVEQPKRIIPPAHRFCCLKLHSAVWQSHVQALAGLASMGLLRWTTMKN